MIKIALCDDEKIMLDIFRKKLEEHQEKSIQKSRK